MSRFSKNDEVVLLLSRDEAWVDRLLEGGRVGIMLKWSEPTVFDVDEKTLIEKEPEGMGNVKISFDDMKAYVESANEVHRMRSRVFEALHRFTWEEDPGIHGMHVIQDFARRMRDLCQAQERIVKAWAKKYKFGRKDVLIVDMVKCEVGLVER